MPIRLRRSPFTLVRMFPRIAGENFRPPQLVEGDDLVGLRRDGFRLHAGSADRHSGDAEAGNVGAEPKQPDDLFGRDVSFEYVAIDDGRMAGAEVVGNTVFPLESGDAADLGILDRESPFGEMLAPAGTAASAGNLVDLDDGAGRDRLGHGGCSQDQQQGG